MSLQLRAGLAGADWNEPASVTALFVAAQKYITSSVIKLASLIWPQKAHTGAWWEEEDGQEYIQQQHFSPLGADVAPKLPLESADDDEPGSVRARLRERVSGP